MFSCGGFLGSLQVINYLHASEKKGAVKLGPKMPRTVRVASLILSIAPTKRMLDSARKVHSPVSVIHYLIITALICLKSEYSENAGCNPGV